MLCVFVIVCMVLIYDLYDFYVAYMNLYVFDVWMCVCALADLSCKNACEMGITFPHSISQAFLNAFKDVFGQVVHIWSEASSNKR